MTAYRVKIVLVKLAPDEEFGVEEVQEVFRERDFIDAESAAAFVRSLAKPVFEDLDHGWWFPRATVQQVEDGIYDFTKPTLAVTIEEVK